MRWKRRISDAMKVLIPTPLFSYTASERMVEAKGATLAEALLDLDRQFPGIRFRMIDEQDRIRRHIRFFVNNEQEFSLDRRLDDKDEIFIVQALSGG
jgi:molybdopterin converting factor small subunit